MDCIQGDHMLFWRQDGVELCWSFLDPILDACGRNLDTCPELQFYTAGTRGPADDCVEMKSMRHIDAFGHHSSTRLVLRGGGRGTYFLEDLAP